MAELKKIVIGGEEYELASGGIHLYKHVVSSTSSSFASDCDVGYVFISTSPTPISSTEEAFSKAINLITWCSMDYGPIWGIQGYVIDNSSGRYEKVLFEIAYTFRVEDDGNYYDMFDCTDSVTQIA